MLQNQSPLRGFFCSSICEVQYGNQIINVHQYNPNTREHARKSTLACALSRGLHSRGKLTYILDGDNVRHGLNGDLSSSRGPCRKYTKDGGCGVICIASLISPYRKDRDACRALLPEGEFIEVFMDVPLKVCEARDPKGLYKLARAGQIEGFTGIDDPYEPPLNAEIVLKQKGKVSDSPDDMAEIVHILLGGEWLSPPLICEVPRIPGWEPASTDNNMLAK
ncbi:unnamed protein product [Thlaspi arvense]|uniref:Adenylyl-sulfate kinase n=1 Tax=Thlaspi arvense TaxID=13288 RepID=A0AAU9S794_THLAR|nr:unnamed protein product [Thlaspi arvense]